jgi:NAD(P)H-hydrate epimerase
MPVQYTGRYTGRMTAHTDALYSAAQVRDLDRRAIADCGIAGYEIMTRAGPAALEGLA